jgi:hypothetical protein
VTLASSKFAGGDFTDEANRPKAASRWFNLFEIQRSNMACDIEGRLRCDVLDLCGSKAPMFQIFRDTGMLAPPHRYFGVDHTVANIEENRALYADEPNCMWYPRSLAGILRNKRRTLQNVGVLNFDTCGLARGQQWEDDLHAIRSFVEHQRHQIGGFVLIINAGVWRGTTTEEFMGSIEKVYGRPVDPAWVYWYHGESTDENGKVHKHSKRANVVLHYRGANQNGLTLEDTFRKVQEKLGT